MFHRVERVEYNDPNEVPLKSAQEVAQVGVLPVAERWPNGYTFEMAGQRFTVVGECTVEEFEEALRTSGIAKGEVRAAQHHPPEYHYLRVVTD